MGLEQRIHEIGGVVVLAVHPAHAGQRLGVVGALVHLIGTGGAGVHLLQQIKVGILLLQEGTDPQSDGALYEQFLKKAGEANDTDR